MAVVFFMPNFVFLPRSIRMWERAANMTSCSRPWCCSSTGFLARARPVDVKLLMTILTYWFEIDGGHELAKLIMREVQTDNLPTRPSTLCPSTFDPLQPQLFPVDSPHPHCHMHLTSMPVDCTCPHPPRLSHAALDLV